MGAGISTIKTVLKAGRTANDLRRLCRTRTYPDVGGKPDVLQTTELQDKTHTFAGGIDQVEAMTFTATYNRQDYESVLETEGEPLVYQLEFGEEGSQGIFYWTGYHFVYVNSKGVNEVREMTIVVFPRSPLTTVLSILVDENGDPIITSNNEPISL